MTGPAARRHTPLPVHLWIDIKALHTEQNIHRYKPGNMKRKRLFLSVYAPLAFKQTNPREQMDGVRCERADWELKGGLDAI